MKEKRDAYWLLVGEPEGTRPPRKTVDKGRRIILKWILEKSDGVALTGFSWLWAGTCGGLL
jgi:hypothetical protein